jgi:hypothetical protein
MFLNTGLKHIQLNRSLRKSRKSKKVNAGMHLPFLFLQYLLNIVIRIFNLCETRCAPFAASRIIKPITSKTETTIETGLIPALAAFSPCAQTGTLAPTIMASIEKNLAVRLRIDFFILFDF